MINSNSPYEFDEMLFQRNQFYGTNFTFYLIDSVNSIAVFSSGHYPIPKDVFRDKSEYLKVDDYMQNLPRLCNSFLSPKYKRLAGDYSLALLEANRGLYSFDEENNWTYNYDLYALPNKELKLTNLPKEIEKYLSSFKIEKVKFAELQEIDILDYFECDLTPQK